MGMRVMRQAPFVRATARQPPAAPFAARTRRSPHRATALLDARRSRPHVVRVPARTFYRLLFLAAARRLAGGLAYGLPLGLALSAPLRAQVALPPAHTITARHLTSVSPAIDGQLSDDVWRVAPDVPPDAFITTSPVAGGEPSLRTAAWVSFDDVALYVAVRAFDPRPDSIAAPYARRDDETTADWIFVEIDSRHDRRTGSSFGLDPRGVQVDGAWANDADYDASWNGVWDGAARVDASGWTAEFRIPFSQLALPAGAARHADHPRSQHLPRGATTRRNVEHVPAATHRCWCACRTS